MSLLSEETEVFEAAPGQRCAVVFLVRRRTPAPGDTGRTAAALGAELDALRAEGWWLSVDRILDGERPDGGEPADASPGERTEDARAAPCRDVPAGTESTRAAPHRDVPTVYATGFSHDVDYVGMFEAPSPSSALAGTRRLEEAGWSRVFRTVWLLGQREFLPVVGPASRREDEWAFFALWSWNSAWQAATAQQRRAYDEECDVAFAADVRDGAAITGRHRLDGASRWDHIGVWRVPGVAMVDRAMREHARVADFKFTTSRHYIGRRTRLDDALRRK